QDRLASCRVRGPVDAPVLRCVPRPRSQARRLFAAVVGRLLQARGPRRPAFPPHQRRLFLDSRPAAPAAAGRASQPGRDTEMSLTGAARIAGIMGWPVSQAFSPRLHGFWLNEMGIDGALVPLAVEPEDFSTVVRGLMKAGFKGSSVTIPHKEAAFALAHEVDLAARAAGAVNLLIFHDDGRIEGRNTDATGLAASLRENLGADFVRGKPAVLLGAGGAARAGVVALHDLGASEIRILNRTKSRAEQLVATLAKEVKPRLVVFDDGDWIKAA